MCLSVESFDDFDEDLIALLHVAEVAVFIQAMIHLFDTITANLHIKSCLLQLADARQAASETLRLHNTQHLQLIRQCLAIVGAERERY